MIVERDKKRAVIFGLYFLSTCLVLGALSWATGFDKVAKDFFVEIQSSSGIELMKNVSHLAEATVVAFLSIIVILIAVLNKSHRELSFYLTSVVIGPLISGVLKPIFERARPEEIFAKGFSFPSGHTTTAMAIYGALAFIAWPKYKWLSGILLIVPLLVGISRMYLSVHWLSDVFGGLFFGGLLILVLALLFYRKK